MGNWLVCPVLAIIKQQSAGILAVDSEGWFGKLAGLPSLSNHQSTISNQIPAAESGGPIVGILAADIGKLAVSIGRLETGKLVVVLVVGIRYWEGCQLLFWLVWEAGSKDLKAGGLGLGVWKRLVVG